MTARFFVDTNVFVYDQDPTDPAKQARAAAWLQMLWSHRAGRISTQILSELYSVLTRKLRTRLPVEDARALLEDLAAWEPVPITPELLRRAWVVESRFGLAWWDCLVVAAAHAAGCTWLLSEDLQDGCDYDGVVVVNPFRVDPATQFGATRAHDGP